MTSPGQRLRDLVDAPEILAMPGISNGYSARLVEQFGFKAALLTGAGLSESHLGWADAGLMGLEENLRASRPLIECCGLPILADADTGYGGPMNVFQTVKAFEKAGAAAVQIEDQVWPKRCGNLQGKQVIAAEEMVEKVRAAVEARRDPGFMIVARTDAFPMNEIGEAIRRLNLYTDAGADMLLADGTYTEDHFRVMVENTHVPLMANMSYGLRGRVEEKLISAKRLQELGVAVVLYPRLAGGAMIQGLKNALGVLRESVDGGAVIERPDLVASFKEQNELMGLNEILDLDKRFSTDEQRREKYEKSLDHVNNVLKSS
ncbi:MAG: oxaloacetate decarboxylase [Rhodospirillales bacterium]